MNGRPQSRRRTPLPSDGGWREFASCVGLASRTYDPFFPVEGTGQPKYVAKMSIARRICRGCPVIGDCLAETMCIEATLPWRGRHGMFGGLTPSERSRLAHPARWAAV